MTKGRRSQVHLTVIVLGIVLGGLPEMAGGVQGAAPVDLERRLGVARGLAERAQAGSPEARAAAAELGDVGAAYHELKRKGRVVGEDEVADFTQPLVPGERHLRACPGEPRERRGIRASESLELFPGKHGLLEA